MSYGLLVRNASGAIIVNTTTQMARIIAKARTDYAAGQSGTRVITLPGILSTDDVYINTTAVFILNIHYVASRSGTSITVTYNPQGNSIAASFRVYAVRFQ